jgi:hypothetical protein
MSKNSRTDKIIAAKTHTVTTTVTEEVIETATYPHTLSSFRWIINYYNGVNSPAAVYWQLMILRQGYSAIDAIGTDSDWNNAEDIIAYGILAGAANNATAGPINSVDQNFTNIKRKMNPGDKLVWLTQSTDANSGTIRSIWQTFRKS